MDDIHNAAIRLIDTYGLDAAGEALQLAVENFGTTDPGKPKYWIDVLREIMDIQSVPWRAPNNAQRQTRVSDGGLG